MEEYEPVVPTLSQSCSMLVHVGEEYKVVKTYMIPNAF